MNSSSSTSSTSYLADCINELTPDTVKIDFNINDFPYAADAAANTRLGLLANMAGAGRARSGGRGRFEPEDAGNAAVTDIGDITGGIVWDRTCKDDDDNDVDVLTTILAEREAEGEFGGKFRARRLVWTFATDKPAGIYWDPTVGLVDVATVGGLAPVIGVGAAVLVGVIVGAVFLMKKGKSASSSAESGTKM